MKNVWYSLILLFPALLDPLAYPLPSLPSNHAPSYQLFGLTLLIIRQIYHILTVYSCCMILKFSSVVLQNGFSQSQICLLSNVVSPIFPCYYCPLCPLFFPYCPLSLLSPVSFPNCTLSHVSSVSRLYCPLSLASPVPTVPCLYCPLFPVPTSTIPCPDCSLFLLSPVPTGAVPRPCLNFPRTVHCL